MNNKVCSIELFRFLFMVVICLWHLTSVVPLMAHGGAPVEFFFILSGFLMYNTLKKTNAPGPLDFTLKKIKRFHFIIVTSGIFTLCCMHDWIPATLRGNDVLGSLFRVIEEILLIRTNGIFQGGLNGPTWYVSVLIWGGALLYSIVYTEKKKSLRIYIPILCWCVYAYLLKEGTGKLPQWGVVGCFQISVLRGMAGMGLGILVSYIFDKKRQFLSQKTSIIVLNFLSVFAIIIYIGVIMAIEDYDEYTLLCSPLIIVSCFTSGTWLNKLPSNRIINYLGGISLEMLMIHFPIFKIIETNPSFTDGFPKIAIVGLFLFVVFVVAAALHHLNDYYLKKVFGK